MSPFHVVLESPELAVELHRLDGSTIAHVASSSQGATWLTSAASVASDEPVLGIALLTCPELVDLVKLAYLAESRGQRVALCVLEDSPRARTLLGAGDDLQLAVVHDLGPLLAVLRLLALGVRSPNHASTRLLSTADRLRLEGITESGIRRSGYLHSLADGQLGYATSRESQPVVLGAARDVEKAIRAVSLSGDKPPRVSSSVDDVDERLVLDVLFGPRRALSDPASKAALRPYSLPLPTEELCTSPSRAAAEAARIGFPVRIAMASPDVRVWDHPELAIDMVGNAAQVRDAFRELVALTQTPSSGPPPRILGVTVMATAITAASFRILAWPLPQGRVAAEVSFNDRHGIACLDATTLVLPLDVASIERALRRLAGHSIVLPSSSADRKQRVESMADVLLRLAAFVNDRRLEVESVELRPVCMLLDGSMEAREACVQVSDAFERNLTASLG